MAARVRERFAAGDRRGVRDAVLDAYVDAIGLYGPPARLRERVYRYADADVDELVVELRKPDLADQMAELEACGMHWNDSKDRTWILTTSPTPPTSSPTAWPR